MWKKIVMAMGFTGILLLTACGAGENETAGVRDEAVRQEEAGDAGDKETPQDETDLRPEVLQNKDNEENPDSNSVGNSAGNASEDPAGNSGELSGELTILSWYPNEEFLWEGIIRGFEELHPGVTINVDSPEEQELYMENYTTKVLSGEGYDIVVEADFASAKKGWADSGLFVDLYELMDADEDFHKEDFFSSIYEPMETDGKLLRILRTASPVYIRMNRRLLEQAGVEYSEETISFDELCDIYEKVREVCGEEIYLTEGADYEPFAAYEGNYYIHNGLADTDEFEEYLRKNHEMYYEEEARQTYSEYGQGIASDVLCRVFAPCQNIAPLLDDIFEGTEDFTPAIRYVNSLGMNFFYATNCLSISSFSGNKELAWEFLKFAVGNYDGVDYRGTGFSPPNKERFLSVYESVKPEIRERIFRDVESINAVITIDLGLSDSLKSIFDDYYINNTLTAAECRKALADRIYLYRNE